MLSLIHIFLIEGVTLLNSPFWVIHPLFCESLIVSGVTVFNRGPNGDGFLFISYFTNSNLSLFLT